MLLLSTDRSAAPRSALGEQPAAEPRGLDGQREQRLLVAHAKPGGSRSAHGRSASSCAHRASSGPSAPARATICTDSGRPSRREARRHRRRRLAGEVPDAVVGDPAGDRVERPQRAAPLQRADRRRGLATAGVIRTSWSASTPLSRSETACSLANERSSTLCGIRPPRRAIARVRRSRRSGCSSAATSS